MRARARASGGEEGEKKEGVGGEGEGKQKWYRKHTGEGDKHGRVGNGMDGWWRVWAYVNNNGATVSELVESWPIAGQGPECCCQGSALQKRAMRVSTTRAVKGVDSESERKNWQISSFCTFGYCFLKALTN